MSKKATGTVKDNIDRFVLRDHKKIRKYLVRVIEGKEVDLKPITGTGRGSKDKAFECATCHGRVKTGDALFELTPGGVVFKAPLPASVRVQAAKALKELQIDKSVADKKDVQRVEKILDTTAALEDIAARKEAEKRAMELGKLKKIGGGK